LTASFGDMKGLDNQHINLGCGLFVYENHGQDSRVTDLGDTRSTVSAKYGTGGGNTPIVCFGSNGDQSEKTHSMGEREEQAPTLRADGPAHAAMVHWQQGGGEVEDNVSGALRANAEHSYQFARIQSTVRRLTPRECERLQGFPDDHTAVQYRNKPACDGPRYKALGNSMAVPCIQFILENLQKIAKEKA
jgi:DNA (cytosine-5)-methyltransferase 1